MARINSLIEVVAQNQSIAQLLFNIKLCYVVFPVSQLY